MQPRDQWPLSFLSRSTLQSEIACFLRTHLQGEQLLHEFRASTAPDRTEEQFEQERKRAEAARWAERQRALKLAKARQRAGLPFFDLNLLLVPTRR